MAKKYKANIFEILKFLTHQKKPWEKLTKDEQKMGSFMINKWLSMHPDLLPIVNYLQRYTVGQLSDEIVYKLYYDLLPETKLFFRYVKGKKADKYNTELLKIVAKHLETSTAEAEGYLDILFQKKDKKYLTEFLKMYGKTDLECRKLLK